MTEPRQDTVEKVGARIQLWWMTQKHEPMSQDDAQDLARAAINAMSDVRDDRLTAIRYMDAMARQLAREGKFDQTAILHAASAALESLSGGGGE